MYWAEIWKISDFFLAENFHFLVMKCSIYLIRRVFIMICGSQIAIHIAIRKFLQDIHPPFLMKLRWQERHDRIKQMHRPFWAFAFLYTPKDTFFFFFFFFFFCMERVIKSKTGLHSVYRNVRSSTLSVQLWQFSVDGSDSFRWTVANTYKLCSSCFWHNKNGGQCE